ncbi:Brp/Blh family beta-carotene 15,15'-dioxygenase [Halohasta salina]|uniref:Brp/Blh family beta-carotene 15,15'-dioxygenase n=1 Tax=Halohasta salina TaxID=2961621 RepID=UPI0020A2436A|nr:Brp/Blh family beta-carotene 15,15'-dioxygenase [Halohasta salina]
MNWPLSGGVSTPNRTERDRAVFRLAFLGPWLALAVTALAVLVFGAPSRQLQLVPFAVSIVIFGLPHGAVDHLTLPWAYGEPPTRRWLAIVGGLYLVVGVAYTAVWFVAPVAAFGVFILITWFHWGQGEVHPLVELVDPTHLRTRAARALTVAARGSLPMVVPLVAFPEEYRWVAARLVGLFGTVDLAALDPVFSVRGRMAAGALVATLLVATLAVGYRDGEGRRTWAVDIGELLFLTAYFVIVPPILAIGIFFPCWHSVRHITRLLLLDESAAARLDAGELGGALARFGRLATPMTVGALAIFGGLALAVPASPVDGAGLFALYLVGIAVVTAPHVVVVTVLDLREGIW